MPQKLSADTPSVLNPGTCSYNHAVRRVCFLYKFTRREQHLHQVRHMEDFTATISNAAHYGQEVFKHKPHSLGPKQLSSVLKRNH